MEIKIGISNITREVTIETETPAEEVEASLREALASKDGVLALTDDKGRRVLVPAMQIAYLDLGHEQQRQVGFGAV